MTEEWKQEKKKQGRTRMRRRKNQVVVLDDTDLKRPPSDAPDFEKKTYKQNYQKKYKSKYFEKTKVIQISVSNEEYDRLKIIAKDEKKPLSKLVLEGFYAYQKKADIRGSGYRDIVYQLSKIGNNINQIAAKLNAKKFSFSSPKKEFETFAKDVRAMMHTLINLHQK